MKPPPEKPLSEKPPPEMSNPAKSPPENVQEGVASLENPPSNEISVNEPNLQPPSSQEPIKVDAEARKERSAQETTTSKPSQVEAPPVKHIYPKRNPHINHSQPKSFLGQPSSNNVVVIEHTENTVAAARKAKNAPKGKQPFTNTKGKGQKKDSEAPSGGEKGTQGKLETRRDAAKAQEVSSEGSEASKKAEDAEENISNSRKRVGKEIGKVLEIASQLAIMKLWRNKMMPRKGQLKVKRKQPEKLLQVLREPSQSIPAILWVGSRKVER